MKQQLIDVIRKRKAKVAVVGLGYVGLPTAAAIAAKGYYVIGVDVDRGLLRRISNHKISLVSRDLHYSVLRSMKARRFALSAHTVAATSVSNILIVCVPTPMDQRKRPDLRYVSEACKQISKGLTKDKLILIESTVPPGTVQNNIIKTLQSSGLRCGAEFWLAYCPERLTPSKAYTEIRSSPRLVGGVDPESTRIAREFYKQIIRANIYSTDALTAEIAKLAENSYRDVNIAFANELAVMCENLGANVFDVIKLANTHPRVRIHQPGIGVGGPCLTKDPYFLIHSASNAKLLPLSRRINDQMPLHVLHRILNVVGNRNPNKKRVAILGVAYKADTDDTRNSPAEVIVRHLLNRGINVVVYDPYSKETFGARRAENLYTALKGADCCLIATPHKAYRTFNLRRASKVMKRGATIVDGTNLFNLRDVTHVGLRYYGIGKGRRK